MYSIMSATGTFKKALLVGAAVASLGAAPILTAQPAAAFGHGGFGGGGFYRPHGGGFGGYRGGFGGYRGRYYGGYGYGLAGLGLGFGLGAVYGGYYGAGYPYYDGGYGGYGPGPYYGCVRRVYGYYGPHLVRVC